MNKSRPTLEQLVQRHKEALIKLRGMTPDNPEAITLLSEIKDIRLYLSEASLQRVEYQFSGVYQVPVMDFAGIHPDIMKLLGEPLTSPTEPDSIPEVVPERSKAHLDF